MEITKSCVNATMWLWFVCENYHYFLKQDSIHIYLSIYLSIYIYIYIYIYMLGFFWCLSEWAGGIFYWWSYNFMCLWEYKTIYALWYTLIVNISFFHRLMSLEVQPCVNLNGVNRKEGRPQQEKKRQRNVWIYCL